MVPAVQPELLSLPDIDFDALRDYRLGRVRAELARHQVDMAVLTNQLSLQYALDFHEYQLYQTRIPTMLGLIPVDGPIALSGAYNRDYKDVAEYLPSFALSQFDAGLDLTDKAREFAEFLHGRMPLRTRIAVDRLEASVVQALMQVGFDVVDVGGMMEAARSIKSPEEVQLIRHAIAVAKQGMAAMRSALKPGITENQLFSHLHQVNIANGGRWTDGRMLCSGPRTNPWLQEATDRQIQAGDLVGFDTDMVGPYGYFADVSRTWICDADPSREQKILYRQAVEEVNYNLSLLKPGLSFKEWSDKAFRQPEIFIAHRYPCLSHGAGMGDEWPKIAYRQDWDKAGYEGEVKQGMVLCVESFVGREDGGEGVKIEQQVLVTENGYEILSDDPLEEAFLS